MAGDVSTALAAAVPANTSRLEMKALDPFVTAFSLAFVGFLDRSVCQYSKSNVSRIQPADWQANCIGLCKPLNGVCGVLLIAFEAPDV
jgi:hypothetical protein